MKLLNPVNRKYPMVFNHCMILEEFANRPLNGVVDIPMTTLFRLFVTC